MEIQYCMFQANETCNDVDDNDHRGGSEHSGDHNDDGRDDSDGGFVECDGNYD